MAQSSICPRCGGTVVHGFNVGRAVCNVCIVCGLCTVHNNVWPSVAKQHKEKEPRA